MRISKLARKYDLSIQELTVFLEKLDIPNQSLHPNAKLDEETIDKVALQFDFSDQDKVYEPEVIEQELTMEEVTEDKHEKEKPLVHQTEVELEKQKEPSFDRRKEEVVSESQEELSIRKTALDKEEEVILTPPSEEEVILSDQLLEMIESEDTASNLEKIKLIKAPKKELSGLKVLGKIEVPEDPRKKQKEQKEAERQAATTHRPKLTEEEKEERRLKAKKKREDYEARKERRQKQQKEQEKKARKAEYYKKSIEQNMVNSPVPKPKKKRIEAKTPNQFSDRSKPQPKTFLGKFWRWLNSSGYE